MALTKEQKKEKIESLKKVLDKQKSIVMIDFSNLKTRDIDELKKILKDVSSEFKIAKKTLAELAFKTKNITFDREKWQGQLGFVFGYDDEIAPFRAAYQFSKKNENLKIIGGFVDNNFISQDKALEIAQLPSKDELMAKLVSSLQAPIYNFVYVLSANIKGLVYALQAISSK